MAVSGVYTKEARRKERAIDNERDLEASERLPWPIGENPGRRSHLSSSFLSVSTSLVSQAPFIEGKFQLVNVQSTFYRLQIKIKISFITLFY